MPDDDYYLRVRIPDSLRRRLLKSAALNNRSLTGEILARLQASLELEGRIATTDDDLKTMSDRLYSLEEQLQRHIAKGKEPYLLQPLKSAVNFKG